MNRIWFDRGAVDHRTARCFDITNGPCGGHFGKMGT